MLNRLSHVAPRSRRLVLLQPAADQRDKSVEERDKRNKNDKKDSVACVRAALVLAATLAIALTGAIVRAQPPATGATPQPPTAGSGPNAARDEGIPVENQLVRARCGGCHKT